VNLFKKEKDKFIVYCSENRITTHLLQNDKAARSCRYRAQQLQKLLNVEEDEMKRG
jgi:hypothetical protein